MDQTLPPFPYFGEIASLTAALLWSISLTLFTKFGGDLPSQTMNLYKNLVAFVSLGIFAALFGPDLTMDPYLWLELGLSGIIGLSLGDTALFAALKRLGAQVTSASQCIAPPIAAMIAMVFLDETLNALEWMGLVLTIVGVAAVIFFRGKGPIIPTAARFVFWGVVFAILSACCQGIAVVIQRHGMQSIHVLYGTMIRIAPAILVLILINARGSSWKQLHLIWQHKSKRIYLTAASFMGTCLGLTCLSLGTKYSKAGIAAALTSTYPIWIIPVAYFLLGEKTSPKSIGATFVAVAGIVLMTVG